MYQNMNKLIQDLVVTSPGHAQSTFWLITFSIIEVLIQAWIFCI